MSPELEAKLYKKYPKIFAQRHLPATQTCMVWGIETQDGWYPIIDRLCALIQKHVEWQRTMRAQDLKFNRALTRAIKGDTAGLIAHHSFQGKVTEHTMRAVEKDLATADIGKGFREVRKKMDYVQAVQVKEKFGTLRFYIDYGDDYVNGLIAMAESMSSVICETCGKPGQLRYNGWIRTACDEHAI